MQNKASFHVLTFEFYLHVLIRIVAKISVCFYNYSPHSKPPASFGFLICLYSYVCMLHDKPTHCFVIFAEVGVKIFLIEFPKGKHMLFHATLDHKDLILVAVTLVAVPCVIDAMVCICVSSFVHGV